MGKKSGSGGPGKFTAQPIIDVPRETAGYAPGSKKGGGQGQKAGIGNFEKKQFNQGRGGAKTGMGTIDHPGGVFVGSGGKGQELGSHKGPGSGKSGNDEQGRVNTGQHGTRGLQAQIAGPQQPPPPVHSPVIHDPRPPQFHPAPGGQGPINTGFHPIAPPATPAPDGPHSAQPAAEPHTMGHPFAGGGANNFDAWRNQK